MNLTLDRCMFEKDGIFGVLRDESDNVIAVALEHAYPKDSRFLPKLPDGTYTCKRGMHRLHGMTNAFETFEICGVPGHTNILFHWGNYNKDSEGCVLLGRRVVQNPDSPKEQMITSSKNTFLKFMDIQKGINQFTLIVE